MLNVYITEPLYFYMYLHMMQEHTMEKKKRFFLAAHVYASWTINSLASVFALKMDLQKERGNTGF